MGECVYGGLYGRGDVLGEVFGAGVYVAVEGVYPVCQFDKGFAAVFE